MREAQVMAGVRKLLTLLRNSGALTWKRMHTSGVVIRGKLFNNREGRGMADILVFLPGGLTLHWELKATAGRQSPEQESWARELASFGHEYFLIRSVDEAVAVLRAFGVEHFSFPRSTHGSLTVNDLTATRCDQKGSA